MTEPDPNRSTITLSELSDVVCAARETNELFEETTWWRGHANAEWRLEAQVYRKDPENPDRSSSAETALIGHFRSRAPSRSHRPCPAADDFFGWLFLAQHYGLPTRLLDWTESPLVAMYFAVIDCPDDDGCIWALGPTVLNRALVDLDGLVIMQNPRAEKIAENAFTGNASPEPVIIAIDGQEIDPRMLAQMSRFTVHLTAHHWSCWCTQKAPNGCVSYHPKGRQGQNSRAAFNLWHPAFESIPRPRQLGDRVERTRVVNARPPDDPSASMGGSAPTPAPSAAPRRSERASSWRPRHHGSCPGGERWRGR